VLIILIAAQFKKEPVKEVDIPAQSTETNTVAVDSQNLKEVKGAEETLIYLRDDQKGFYYSIKGSCCYDKNEYDNAFDLYMKSLTCYLKTKDVNTIADLYVKVDNCLYRTRKYDMALGYYLGAKRYINENISHDIAAKILYDIALCYISLKRYDPAGEYMEICREYINSHEWPGKNNLVPGINMMKGIIERDLKLNRVGLEEFNQAFEQYKQDNNIAGMGRAKNNAALCLWDLGEKEKAIEYFREALKYKDQCGDETLVDTYTNMAELYKEMENIEGALDIINAAEEKMLSKDSTEGLIEIFRTKFEYLAEIKDYDRAEIFAFLALDYIEKTGDKKAESKLYVKLSEMHKNMGDENTAIEYLIKANKI
jgi:tetratricopeptide (TPR) repeat protein